VSYVFSRGALGAVPGLYAPSSAAMVQMSAASIPPPPSGAGYIWVPPASGKAGYWRRALPGETGQTAEKAGITVVTPETRRPDPRPKPSDTIRAQCAASGMPPELVEECVKRALAKGATRGGGTVEEMNLEFQAAQASKRRKYLIYGALGLGAVGLIYYLRKREKRGEES